MISPKFPRIKLVPFGPRRWRRGDLYGWCHRSRRAFQSENAAVAEAIAKSNNFATGNMLELSCCSCGHGSRRGLVANTPGP